MADHDPKLRLYLAHRAALIDYATPIVGCRLRAEDVVQEAYLRFVPAGDSGPTIHQPVAYLYRIVRNMALDLRRSLSAESRRHEAQAVFAPAESSVPSPEEHSHFRNELRLADAALAELPPKVRRAFELRRVEGRTFQEIADELGVAVGTACRWAQEAFVHVARRLEAGEDDPPERGR